MIPVHLKTIDRVEPPEATYYLLAANGTFLVKQTGLFTSVTEVKRVIGLEDQSVSLTLSIPRVPRQLLERIYGFFQFVYQRLDGEAIVFIYYSPERREFHADAPPQQLTRYRTRRGWRTEGKVEYRSLPRPDGFLKLGDAHSHGDGSAFFSATDDRDDTEDGLRVVMGRFDRPNPDVRVSFVASRTRFPVETDAVLEDFSTPVPPPQAWVRRMNCRYEDSARRTRHHPHGSQWH